MKITPFDELYPTRAGVGGGVTAYSSGSNDASGDVSGGGDVVGDPVDYSVVGLRNTVALASNIGGGTVGDVLTIIATSPRLAAFATPSNAGVSFGSNATRVSEDPYVGAMATAAREDHRHDGIGQITASSSNTLQRGTVNLRPGTNVSFGLTDGDGDGELDTLTVNAQGGSSGGATFTIPSFVQIISGSFSTGTTALAVTMTAPTNGNTVLMWVCSGAREPTSITQTNVTWTKLYGVNGNTQYVSLWAGAASASAGTTATVNFASSTRVQAFGVETTTGFTTAGSSASSTGSLIRGLATGPLTVSANDIVVGLTSNNSSAGGMSMANMPFAIIATGGQGNGFILQASGTKVYSQSFHDAASNMIQALVVIS